MMFLRVNTIPIPQPRQRHRVVVVPRKRPFVQNYTPANHPVNAYKGILRRAFQAEFQGPPLAGPLFVKIVFGMPRPGRLCRKSQPQTPVRHTVKPDMDNLYKSTTDALLGLAWFDDAQICSCKVTKWYVAGGDQPGVEITIAPLEEDAPAEPATGLFTQQ